jgi:hypothetical protein
MTKVFQTTFVIFLITFGTLSAQSRLNEKGAYLKTGIATFTDTKGAILGKTKPSFGLNAGFYIEKVGEDAKIGWKAELGVKVQQFIVDFPALPEFNLPHVVGNDVGMRANLVNYLVYRPVNKFQLMFGLDPSVRLMNYKSIHFKSWGYTNFALGYVGAAQFSLNERIRLELNYAKDDLLPTFFQKSAATLIGQQISLGLSYKIK